MTDPTPKQKALDMLDRAENALLSDVPLSVARAWVNEAVIAVALIDERVDGRKHKKKGGPLDLDSTTAPR